MSKAKCLECNTILESKHRHDFQSCECPNALFIDGGDSYLRIGGKDLSKVAIWRSKKWELLSLEIPSKSDEQLELF